MKTDYIYVACARGKASDPRVYDQETTLLVWHIPMKGWLWRLAKVCRSETFEGIGFRREFPILRIWMPLGDTLKLKPRLRVSWMFAPREAVYTPVQHPDDTYVDGI